MRTTARRLSIVLAAAAAAAGAVRAQAPTWLVVEIHTGTPDFVEIQNVSGAPQPVFGVGLWTSNAAACPATLPGSGAAQQCGGYVSTSAVVVPAGGFYVFEELGVAGSASLTTLPSAGGFPPGTLGERMGLNLSWAAGSHGEVAVYVGASLVGGAIVGTADDYVRFLTQPTTGSIPVADGFRYDPPGVGGRWLSGPALRGLASDVLFRVAGAGPGGYADTNSDADWNASGGAHTGGAANPAGVAGVKSSGVDLTFFAAAGTVTIEARSDDAAFAFAEGFGLVSLAPTTCAGGGPLVGLASDVFSLVFLPLGTEPFHVSLDASGNYVQAFVLGGTLGLSVEARFVIFAPPQTLVLSNFVYATI